MAQIKKKRRRKHKGTQAGVTVPKDRQRARPRSRQEARAQARQRRNSRFESKPTMRSASIRAAVAAGLFFLVVLALEKKVVPSISLAAVAFLIYLPLSYWTDLFMYNRHQKKKAQRSGGDG